MRRNKPLARRPIAKKKPKKPTKPKEQALRLKADKVARDWFRKDAGCAACGHGSFQCSPVIQWCHIVRRGCRLIRHSRYNALPLCKSHHVYFTHRPEEWLHFVEMLYPGRFQFLRELDLSRKGMRLVDVYEEEISWFASNPGGFTGWKE